MINWNPMAFNVYDNDSYRIRILPHIRLWHSLLQLKSIFADLHCVKEDKC